MQKGRGGSRSFERAATSQMDTGTVSLPPNAEPLELSGRVSSPCDRAPCETAFGNTPFTLHFRLLRAPLARASCRFSMRRNLSRAQDHLSTGLQRSEL